MSWLEINEQIRECLTKPDPVPCLEDLFDKTGDGMVAFVFGQQYERAGKFHRALMFYRTAETRFPLEEWKQKARDNWKGLKKVFHKGCKCID